MEDPRAMTDPRIPDFGETTETLLAPTEGRLGELTESLLRASVRNALEQAYKEGWNHSRGHGFDLTSDGFVARPGTCPMPLSADWSSDHCQQSGNCGCELKP